MESNKNLEEALSTIWELKERNIDKAQEVRAKLKNMLDLDLFDELINKKHILKSDEKVLLSESGEELAKDLIRRQRLAERLLADVLDIQRDLIDSVACEFEHIISPEVEKSICTLLGHPKLCPHGSPIPPGDCCQGQDEVLKSIVTTLDKLRQGERCKIVYMLSSVHPELDKLLSLGVVPAAIVKIHQTFPTFVVEIDGQQIALDKEIARDINVKKL